MNREKILESAKDCVCKNREQQYGSPENNFSTIAFLWTNYLNASYPDSPNLVVSAEDVAAMMILLKVSRIASGTQKSDNWIDIAGYAACGGELSGEQ